MFCIYETNEKDAFPLELQNTNLFYEPAPFKDGSWGKDKKNDNVYNCFSADVTDCPIFPWISKNNNPNTFLKSKVESI